MKIDEYERGFRDGLKRAVTWLHAEAEKMNDPHAVRILNSAAFSLGTDAETLRKGRRNTLAEDTGTLENDHG